MRPGHQSYAAPGSSPAAAELTPANVADNEEAPLLLPELPAELRFLLGDLHYKDPALRDLWATDGRELVTTRRGPYPHTDAGVEVRRLFHQLRSHAIENLNGQLKGIFECFGQVPSGLKPLLRPACSGKQQYSPMDLGNPPPRLVVSAYQCW